MAALSLMSASMSRSAVATASLPRPAGPSAARSVSTVRPSHRQQNLASARLTCHAFDPNNPLTWNNNTPPEEAELPTLSEDELKQLLGKDGYGTVAAGSKPNSEAEVIQAVNLASMSLATPEMDTTATTAKEAIARGIELSNEANHQLALEMFEMALTLPGSGVQRDRKKNQELSDGEKMSVLYNVACCHSNMGDSRAGMIALAGAIESGFEDFDTARADPDLAELRKEPQFEGLLARNTQQKKGGVMGFLQDLF